MTAPLARLWGPGAAVTLLIGIMLLASPKTPPDQGGISIAGDTLTIALPIIPAVTASHHIATAEEGEFHAVASYSFVSPRDLWLIGFREEIEGAPLTAVHHAHLFSETAPPEPDSACPLARRIFSTARGLVVGPVAAGYGFFVKKGEALKLEAAFAVPEGEATGYANVAYRIIADLAPPGASPRPLVRYHLRVGDGPCRGTFAVPPLAERYVLRSGPEFKISSHTFAEDGTIVTLAGHFHPWQGGRSLTVYLNDEPIHTFLPERRLRGAMEDDIIPIAHPYRAVRRGDRLTFSVEYGNPSPRSLEGTMGIVQFAVAPAEP